MSNLPPTRRHPPIAGPDCDVCHKTRRVIKHTTIAPGVATQSNEPCPVCFPKGLLAVFAEQKEDGTIVPPDPGFIDPNGGMGD